MGSEIGDERTLPGCASGEGEKTPLCAQRVILLSRMALSFTAEAWQDLVETDCTEGCWARRLEGSLGPA